VQLPDWQLEPDAEQLYGDPNDQYYYTDDQGNLIQPNGPDEGRPAPLTPDGQDQPLDRQPDFRRADPREPAPAAANDDFLDQATGRGGVPAPQRMPGGAYGPGPRPPAGDATRQAPPPGFGQ
jgi:penicillin-binding protein 1A